MTKYLLKRVEIVGTFADEWLWVELPEGAIILGKAVMMRQSNPTETESFGRTEHFMVIEYLEKVPEPPAWTKVEASK